MPLATKFSTCMICLETLLSQATYDIFAPRDSACFWIAWQYPDQVGLLKS